MSEVDAEADFVPVVRDANFGCWWLGDQFGADAGERVGESLVMSVVGGVEDADGPRYAVNGYVATGSPAPPNIEGVELLLKYDELFR